MNRFSHSWVVLLLLCSMLASIHRILRSRTLLQSRRAPVVSSASLTPVLQYSCCHSRPVVRHTRTSFVAHPSRSSGGMYVPPDSPLRAEALHEARIYTPCYGRSSTLFNVDDPPLCGECAGASYDSSLCPAGDMVVDPIRHGPQVHDGFLPSNITPTRSHIEQ